MPAVGRHQARARVSGQGRGRHQATAGGRHGEQGQWGPGARQASEGGRGLTVAVTRGGEKGLGLEDGGRVQLPGVDVLSGVGVRDETGGHRAGGGPQTRGETGARS